MYRIGTKIEEDVIYHAWCASQKNMFALIDQYYRCPKKVLKLIENGDYYRIGHQSYFCSSMRNGHAVYHGSDYGFLTFFATSNYNLLFKNGTWFVGKIYHEDVRLLSKYLLEER